MFIEREAFRQQGLTADVDEIDNMICKGLLQKEKVDRFWRSVQDAILDRMARRMLKKRSGAHDEEVKRFAEAKEPEIGIEHLSEETRMRIPDLESLLELRQRMQMDRLRAADLKAEY